MLMALIIAKVKALDYTLYTKNKLQYEIETGNTKNPISSIMGIDRSPTLKDWVNNNTGLCWMNMGYTDPNHEMPKL